MNLSRLAIVLLFVGAFAALAVVKHQRRQQREQVREEDAERREQIRRFWEVYRQASRARREGDFERAVALYRQALQLRPAHEDSLYYLGNVLCELKRYHEALDMYQRLIAVNPQGSSRGYMRLGLVHASLDPKAPRDWGKAEHFFQRALETDPDSGALLNLGELALLRERWEEAWRMLFDFNTDNTMHPAAPYLLGYLCWRRGQREEAWTWFRRALERLRLKKPKVRWSEEGDIKADPELRWQALAQQSIFGEHWLRLRVHLDEENLEPALMEQEYRRFQRWLERFLRSSSPGDG
jgi:tetratricopeptide (TPR) repeat protein